MTKLFEMMSRASGTLAAVVLGFALMAVPTASAAQREGDPCPCNEGETPEACAARCQSIGVFTCGPTNTAGSCSGSCSILICPLTPNVAGACVCIP